jgi:hypothetical protein
MIHQFNFWSNNNFLKCRNAVSIIYIPGRKKFKLSVNIFYFKSINSHNILILNTLFVYLYIVGQIKKEKVHF